MSRINESSRAGTKKIRETWRRAFFPNDAFSHEVSTLLPCANFAAIILMLAQRDHPKVRYPILTWMKSNWMY